MMIPEPDILQKFQQFKNEAAHQAASSIFKRIRHSIDQAFYKDETEYLELPGIPHETQVAIIKRLGKMSNRSGYNLALIHELETLILSNPPALQTPLKILDIGMGCGDLLAQIWKWAQRKNISVELHGLDLSENFVKSTQENLHQQNIPAKLYVGNACDFQQFPDNHFDVTVCSAMVHHIRDVGQVAKFLANVYRLNRKGWLIADYNRNPFGVLALIVGFLSGGNGLLFQEGLRSFRRAYRPEEINFLIQLVNDPGMTQAMHCRAYPLFPVFWFIKGSKT